MPFGMRKSKIMERLRRKEVLLKSVQRLPYSCIGENDCSVEFFTNPLQGMGVSYETIQKWLISARGKMK